MGEPHPITKFSRRQFSGYDVLQFMEEEGIGVGATMHIVEEAERQHERNPETYRKLDGVQPVIDYIRTLNDMYGWNDWIADKLEQKFGATDS